jgi:hypothetical protein
MDGGLAQKTINDYGRILEETSSITNSVPESLLPYDKEIIKLAIKASIEQLSPKDIVTRNSLEVGYILLANFVPNYEAQITAKYQEAIVSGNTNHPNWKHGEPALKIMDKISEDMNVLSKEIRSYVVQK